MAASRMNLFFAHMRDTHPPRRFRFERQGVAPVEADAVAAPWRNFSREGEGIEVDAKRLDLLVLRADWGPMFPPRRGDTALRLDDGALFWLPDNVPYRYFGPDETVVRVTAQRKAEGTGPAPVAPRRPAPDYVAVATLAERDAIPARRRRAMLLVGVAENTTVYRLGPTLANDDWHGLATGDGPPAACLWEVDANGDLRPAARENG